MGVSVPPVLRPEEICRAVVDCRVVSFRVMSRIGQDYQFRVDSLRDGVCPVYKRMISFNRLVMRVIRVAAAAVIVSDRILIHPCIQFFQAVCQAAVED